MPGWVSPTSRERRWQVVGSEGDGGGAEAAHTGYQGDAAELGQALASQASQAKAKGAWLPGGEKGKNSVIIQG